MSFGGRGSCSGLAQTKTGRHRPSVFASFCAQCVCVCARRAGCDDEGLGQDHAPGGVVVGLCLQRPSPSTGI